MQNESESSKIWQRFRKNKPALAGAFFVGIAIFMAIFGYLLAPDATPDANNQIPELSLRPGRFSATFLLVPHNRSIEQGNLFTKILHGQPAPYRYVPIEQATLDGDSVQFVRIGNVSAIEKIHLAQLFFPILDSIQVREGTFFFKTAGNESQTVSRADLQQKWTAGAGTTVRNFPLGTDKYGRCTLSRLILGFRVSLFVGFVAVIISLTIGLFVGALGGYFGGRVDDLMMLIINTVWSIPTLLLVFAIVLALGRGVGVIFFAVGLTMWVDVARVVRGQVMALRELPFIEAAQSMGFKTGRILVRHILPNLLGPVMVVAASNFATAILVESGLGYLGFGVQPPAASWGSMLNENYGYALGGKPLLALAPAVVIMLTVLAFNLVGNGLRDALDVKRF